MLCITLLAGEGGADNLTICENRGGKKTLLINWKQEKGSGGEVREKAGAHVCKHLGALGDELLGAER